MTKIDEENPKVKKAVVALLAAVQRLADGEPETSENRRLLKAGTLTINKDSVAREARRSRTPLSMQPKTYRIVLDAINAAEARRAAQAAALAAAAIVPDDHAQLRAVRSQALALMQERDEALARLAAERTLAAMRRPAVN